MTDQQYGAYEFEVYFDSVEGRTPGCGDALGWENLTSLRYLTTLPMAGCHPGIGLLLHWHRVI